MFDCWSPFCSGNIIERLESFCRMYYYRREKELAYTLRFITGGIVPIDDAKPACMAQCLAMPPASISWTPPAQPM